MRAEPEQHGEPPARDAPADERDDRQQEREHDRSAAAGSR